MSWLFPRIPLRCMRATIEKKRIPHKAQRNAGKCLFITPQRKIAKKNVTAIPRIPLRYIRATIEKNRSPHKAQRNAGKSMFITSPQKIVGKVVKAFPAFHYVACGLLEE